MKQKFQKVVISKTKSQQLNSICHKILKNIQKSLKVYLKHMPKLALIKVT